MLRTHSAVGSLTALAFVLIIGRADRFQSGKQIASYLGLVPLEESSGDRRRLGHITKKGNSLLRFLLVEAAQVTVRSLPSRLITSIEDGPRMLDPNWRCETWRDRVLVLSTPAKLDL
jgi:transposase